MADRFTFGRLTMRASLILGFGLTFGIWLFAGSYFLRRVDEIERRTAAVDARYMQAQELLSSVRAQILLASVYVRDALLDPQPAATDYREQIESAYNAIDSALSQYVPVLDSADERDRVRRLQQEIQDSRLTMLAVIATDSSRWPADARVLLRTKVVPKRETVIRMSEEVQALNRAAFVQQQREVTEIYGLNQRRLWMSLGLALVASFAVGILVAVYAGGLERSLQRQRASEALNARELQKLSAKLISAQEEERRSLARELHDEVGQVLTAVKVELAVAQRGIESSGGDGRLLEDARTITEGALSTVRDLSLLLHPSMLDDLGLPAAVEWYLRGFSRRYDIRAEVLHERMEQRLAPEIEASAYRIIQEALTNIAKHARASTCRVYLQRLPETVLVTVEDDGVGFEETGLERGAARQGLGLVSIRERALQLRGTARIESSPGHGTRITVELPARPRTPEPGPADDAALDYAPSPTQA